MPAIHENRLYPYKANQTFEYCVSALNTCDITILGGDVNSGIISCGVDGGLVAWPVNIGISVMPEGPDGSSVTYHSEMDFSLFAMGRDKKVAQAFWDTLEFVVQRAGTQQQAVAVEVVNKIQSADVSTELKKLTDLLHEGVLTAEEWQRAKEGLVGKPSSQIDEATRLLRQLAGLAAQGVLTEAEFNMKKVDILSERLMSRAHPVRQTPPSQQPPSACPPLFAVAPDVPLADALACPLCGEPIDERTLVIGNNTCPHCSGVFEAE